MPNQAPNALKNKLEDKYQRLLMGLIIEFPGHTALELARMSGLQNRYYVTGMIDIFSRAGYVVSGPPKICVVSKRTAPTWRLPAPSRLLTQRKNHGT